MSLSKSDSVEISESYAAALSKPAEDAFSFSDSLQRVVAYVRGFTDQATLSDESSRVVDKNTADTVSLSESHTKAVSLGKADSLSFNDSHASAFAKPASDTFGFTDSFARVATYTRVFTDTFTLDELVSISPNWGVDKANVFSFTEAFSYEIKIGHNSVLNSSALNTYTLNL